MYFASMIIVMGLVATGLSQEPQLASLTGAFAISELPARVDNELALVSRPNRNSLSARVLKRQSDDEAEDEDGNGEDDEPQPVRYGPLMGAAQARNCVFCPDPQDLELEGRELLAHLNTEQMRAYMRGDPSQLHNRCVFYTKAEERRGGPKRLSARATQWACNQDKFSVWHLWPNALMARGDLSRYKDFYGIYLEGNWLHKIRQLPRRISPPHPETIYFENMSEAMAQTCTGEVVIITEDPTHMVKFTINTHNLYNDAGNIWGNKEWPALLNSQWAGRAGPFYLVDIISWDTGNENFPVYDYNIRTHEAMLRTTPPWRTRARPVDDESGSNSTDGAGMNLAKRACTRSDGLESEPDDIDIFAGFYPLQ
ncbi:hypothetical protein S7711_11504 [Stachybotrys chartarum IBT 7711]|uniref:Uncharacterized protein n=1 Tax=Stachybotrys chartarum (strain CBS 109288 / IBT 7711) TaxID=1280523 RepID=A0A084AU59_STACB|nr:hypothetical protein S7711_11504 [Stachybotrys chartarum IBT 7711]